MEPGIWVCTGRVFGAISNTIIGVAVGSELPIAAVAVFGDSVVILRSLLSGHEVGAIDAGSVVHAVAWRDSAVVCGCADCKVRVCATSTGGTDVVLYEHGGPVTSVAVTADGDIVVSASGEDMSVVWCSAWDGSGLSRVHLDVPVSTIAVTTACRRGIVAAGCGDGCVRLVDMHCGKVVRVLGRDPGSVDGYTHAGWVTAVAFAPRDGSFVVSATLGVGIAVWETDSGIRMLQIGSLGSDWVDSLAVSPDQRTILACAGDGAVQLWDRTAGKLLQPLCDDSGPVDAAAFAPDGARIVAASRDGVWQSWDLVESHHQHDSCCGSGRLTVPRAPEPSWITGLESGLADIHWTEPGDDADGSGSGAE